MALLSLTNVIMAIGQTTTLTVTLSDIDAAPTFAATVPGVVTIGPVTSNGGNSYSAVVTAAAAGMTQVTVSGSINNAAFTNTVGGTITVGVPATAVIITGPTSLVPGQAGTFTVTINGLVNSPPPTITGAGAGGSNISDLTPVAGSTNSWTFTANPNSAGILTLTASTSVNGNTITSSGTNVTVVAPTITATPNVISLIQGATAQFSVTTNAPPSNGPTAGVSSGPVTVSAVPGGNNFSITASTTQTGQASISVQATVNGTQVTTTVQVNVVAPPTVTGTFSPPVTP
jgi:hypothetical protein